MTKIFKMKDSDLIVEYLGIGTYCNIKDIGNCVVPPIKFIDFDKEPCIKYRDGRTNDVVLMPILTFLNYFEPYDKPVTDAVSVFNNILNAEDERHQKDICALHSRESETDPERPVAGVQE